MLLFFIFIINYSRKLKTKINITKLASYSNKGLVRCDLYVQRELRGIKFKFLSLICIEENNMLITLKS